MTSVANASSPFNESSPSDASTPASKPSNAASGTTTSSKRKRSNKPGAINSKAGSSAATQRELLTPSQKQSNHRNAEVRRRQEITERLTTICDEIVPGAKGLAKSTEAAYTKSHEYLRDMLLEKRALIEEIQRNGGVVPREEIEMVQRLEEYWKIEDGEPSEEEEEEEDSEGDYDDDEGGHEMRHGHGEEVHAAESLHAMKTGR